MDKIHLTDVRYVCSNHVVAPIDTSLRRAYLFFKKHAGYVVGESAKGALKLAKVERRAKAAGLEVEWVSDDDFSLRDDNHEEWCKDGRVAEAVRKGQPVDRDRACNVHVIRGCEHYAEGCIVKDVDGTELASLWGIVDASNEYRRVVEAELYVEALAEYDRRGALAADDARLRGEARELYGDANVTIDDDAEVERTEDGTIRVAAWVRVPRAQ